MSAKKTAIHTDYIKLDAFLKLACAVGSGGEAKLAIEEGEAQVNGEICAMRGKKLRAGDTVVFRGQSYEVVSDGA